MYSDFERDSQVAQRFQKRLFGYQIFSQVLLFWTAAQIGLVSGEFFSYSCPEVLHLGIGYMVNYVLYLFVPLLAILCVNRKKFVVPAIICCGVSIISKIVVIVVLLKFGWRSVGHCYISLNLKAMIIANSATELLALIVQIWLLNRIRQVGRLQDRLTNAINSTGEPMDYDIYTP